MDSTLAYCSYGYFKMSNHVSGRKSVSSLFSRVECSVYGVNQILMSNIDNYHHVHKILLGSRICLVFCISFRWISVNLVYNKGICQLQVGILFGLILVPG